MSKRRERTSGIVAGALLACIHDHGPIQKHQVASATKRVVEQLASAAANGRAVITDTDAASAIDSLQRRLAKLQHGHRVTVEMYDRCRAERDALRAEIERVNEHCRTGGCLFSDQVREELFGA